MRFCLDGVIWTFSTAGISNEVLGQKLWISNAVLISHLRHQTFLRLYKCTGMQSKKSGKYIEKKIQLLLLELGYYVWAYVDLIKLGLIVDWAVSSNIRFSYTCICSNTRFSYEFSIWNRNWYVTLFGYFRWDPDWSNE